MKKVAILGYGGRGYHYGRMCKGMKQDYEVVAVIDCSQEKLELARRTHGFSDDNLYLSIDDFIKKDKAADWVFVCTQDNSHHEHAVKLLNAGYDLLLEKPVACSIDDCVDIERLAKNLDRKVIVCHVLRYSIYYEKIKEIMESGVLGKIISIEQIENVAYWHQAHSYVRGDLRRKDESTPMILAKCCHDLDIAVYLANSKCSTVTSTGALNFFNRENAPEGATEYCVKGCKAKATCPYDCEKLYIDKIKKYPKKVIEGMWPQSRLMSDSIVTIPKLYDAVNNTRYGKCVFLSDNDVVDYQMTNMIFENGINSTLIMTAFCGDSYRETRVRGTLGEIKCNMAKSEIMLDIFGKKIKKVRLGHRLDAHGGGDRGLIVNLAKDTGRTDISMSIESHLIGFGAEISRLNNGQPVKIKDLRKNVK